MVGERERTDYARWVLSLFSFWLQENYRGKTSKGQIEQIKTCRKKQHVRIDDRKERLRMNEAEKTAWDIYRGGWGDPCVADL